MITFDTYKGPHRRFPTGAKPSPKHKLLATPPHRVLTAPPAQFGIVPKKLSMWDNDRDGCCVTTSEAFAKAVWSIMCGLPELFVPDAEVVRWASSHGWLNGADLTEVMDAMAQKGFEVGGQTYNDGPYTGVDYSNAAVLASAISQGPVKIGIMSSALPSGAGNHMGWVGVGPGSRGPEDHCVELSGYGSAGYLFSLLGVPLPTGLNESYPGYLLFTWDTIGFVDVAWIVAACGEAWLRNPTTPGQVPTPPTPPPPPVPPPTTVEGLTLLSLLSAGNYQLGVKQATLSLVADLAAGTYPLVRPTPTPPTPPTPNPVPVLPPDEIAGLQQAEQIIQKILSEQKPH